jgi:hypothetical protein
MEPVVVSAGLTSIHDSGISVVLHFCVGDVDNKKAAPVARGGPLF